MNDITHKKEIRLYDAIRNLRNAAGLGQLVILSCDCVPYTTIDSVRRAIQEWEVAVREYQSETNTPTP